MSEDAQEPAAAEVQPVVGTRSVDIAVYLILIVLLACGGVAVGLAVGAVVPPLVAGLLAERMAIDPAGGPFPAPLALAAATTPAAIISSAPNR